MNVATSVDEIAATLFDEVADMIGIRPERTEDDFEEDTLYTYKTSFRTLLVNVKEIKYPVEGDYKIVISAQDPEDLGTVTIGTFPYYQDTIDAIASFIVSSL